MGNRLYVGNLSYNTTRESLEAAFAGSGEVREVSMPTDRETGQPRGFAFVTMGSAQAANSATTTANPRRSALIRFGRLFFRPSGA